LVTPKNGRPPPSICAWEKTTGGLLTIRTGDLAFFFARLGTVSEAARNRAPSPTIAAMLR
jgi:hypothetical protein